jgi:hypothetical protein
MSRTSAHGAVVAATTVSAVLGLCLGGGLVGGVATDARAAVDAAAVNGVANADGSTVASQDDALSALLGRSTGGSREGVSFGVGSGVPLQLDLATGLDAGGNALGVSGIASSGVALSADVAERIAAAPLPVGVPAQATSVLGGAATPTVVAQTRSFVLAAASDRPRDIAQRLAAARGWNGTQWSCLSQLWQRESMFETTIRNSRSGAYGIPQALPATKMATAGADWRVNPVTQILWGLSYIGTRYGTPCDAWSYWKRHRSY